MNTQNGQKYFAALTLKPEMFAIWRRWKTMAVMYFNDILYTLIIPGRFAGGVKGGFFSTNILVDLAAQADIRTKFGQRYLWRGVSDIFLGSALTTLGTVGYPGT